MPSPPPGLRVLDLRVGQRSTPFYSKKFADGISAEEPGKVVSSALAKGRFGHVPCRTQRPRCALRRRGRPLHLVFPTHLGLWFFTWIDPPAARRATGVQRASNPGPATCKAGPPTRPDSYFPRVIWQWVKSLMASTSRTAGQGRSGKSKLGVSGAVRHGSCTHPASRPGAGQGCRNLPLNSLYEPATQRGFTSDHMGTLP